MTTLFDGFARDREPDASGRRAHHPMLLSIRQLPRGLLRYDKLVELDGEQVRSNNGRGVLVGRVNCTNTGGRAVGQREVHP
jgi:hypothetical protein